jgi:hypothetical protein
MPLLSFRVFQPFFSYPFWEDPKDKGWFHSIFKVGITRLRDKIRRKQHLQK